MARGPRQAGRRARLNHMPHVSQTDGREAMGERVVVDPDGLVARAAVAMKRYFPVGGRVVRDTLALVLAGRASKGDVFGVARLAGIAAVEAALPCALLPQYLATLFRIEREDHARFLPGKDYVAAIGKLVAGFKGN